jgi:hypothetical protein
VFFSPELFYSLFGFFNFFESEYAKQASLGIGARFTTMHWPAVDWVMKELRLPLTANQNSVPRELV